MVLNGSEQKITVEEIRPGSAHAQLVSSLGVAGLGLEGTKFVSVEGAGEPRNPQASERFRELFTQYPDLTFLHAGRNKSQVTEAIRHLESTATSRGEPLKIVGIVDSDYTSDQGARIEGNVLTVGVHEVENLYLEPDVLNAAVSANYGNVSWDGAESEVLKLSEKLAGDWVWNDTHSRNNSE